MQGYAYCFRDGGAIRLLQAGPDLNLESAARITHIYIDTDDVDGFFETYRAAVETLLPEHWRAPFDRYNGQREFHLPHGAYLFFIGKSLPQDAT